ncbi:MAG: TonB-dependent receptor, partial [Rhodanobacter sp.]
MIVFARRRRCGRFRCVYLASAIGLLLTTHVRAQETNQARDYTQPDTSLVKAVNAISQQSGIQVIYDDALLKGKKATAFAGHLTVRQALDKVLAGTGLTYEFVNGDTAVIRKAAAPSAKPAGNPKPANASNASAGNPNAMTLSTVSVTGTRIRGGVTASPTITIDQTDFQQQGLTDLGQVIRDIPQNYRGGQNPGVTPNPNGGDITNGDLSGGSALDLRGLGPDATLTLLNGRRLAYDGFVQAVDIGAIPIAAVDRLEVVPDGASAIYGSDAVAGVANVILKRDFDGVTLGTRYGSTADGGMMSHEYDATAGTTWNSGGLIATFEKGDQSPIYSDQRAYTQYMAEPQTIYPGSTLKSGLLSLHQSLGDVAEFTLDAISTVRTETNLDGYPSYYYQSDSKTSELLIAPGLKFYLPGDWTLSTDVTRGRDSSNYTDNQITPGTSPIT